MNIRSFAFTSLFSLILSIVGCSKRGGYQYSKEGDHLLVKKWENGYVKMIESKAIVHGDTILDGQSRYFDEAGNIERIKSYDMGVLKGEQFEYFKSGALRLYLIMADDSTLSYFRGYGISGNPLKVYGFPFYHINLKDEFIGSSEEVQINFEIAHQPELRNEARIRVFYLPDSILVHDTLYNVKSFGDVYKFKVIRNGDYRIALELRHLDTFFNDSIYHNGFLFFNATLQ